MKTVLGLLAPAASVVLWWSCFGDVPHENPLDPKSPFFVSTGTVRGQVTTYYQPYRGLRGIKLELWPGNESTTTDTSGNFSLRNVPVGEYWLTASHPDYARDSVRISVQQENSARVTFQLDALPRFRGVVGKTFHVSNLPPEDDVDFALFEAGVEDPDGPADITQVWMEIPSLNRADSLQATPEPGIYSTKLFGTDLANGQLHSILGRRLLFAATDRLGHRSRPQELILFRIIDEPPELLAPKDRAAADSVRPLLTWSPLQLSFTFTYTVRVERIVAGIPTMVWERTALPSTSTSMRPDRALARGEHRWTVAAVDEFGNTSTSKPAAFLVP